MNNIDQLLYKIARFIRFLIITATNTISDIFDNNFTFSNLMGVNQPTNTQFNERKIISIIVYLCLYNKFIIMSLNSKKKQNVFVIEGEVSDSTPTNPIKVAEMAIFTQKCKVPNI